MNKKQAVQEFKENILPFIPSNDKPAIREAWHNFTDSLCKDGSITSKQYHNWVNPSFCR